jgi:hypothetical protein
MPPPTPVPRITENDTGVPAAAPSVASDSARQFASLAMRTGRRKASARSRCSGWPFRHVEFAFLISPAWVALPGVPTPTLQPLTPRSRSARATSAATAARVAR